MSPRRADAGTAVLEFVVLVVGLLVPIAYALACFAAVEAAAYASTQAAREAGRAFVTADGVGQGRMRAAAAARLAFADQGLTLPAGALRLECVDGPCLAPGSAVVVIVDWDLPLPWLAGRIGEATPAVLPVSATHRAPVDWFRADPDEA